MNNTIYGIKNCDTMKKARAWLDSHGIAYQFHDYKTVGITRDKLETWCRQVGWQKLLNTAGTTFKKIDEEKKQDIDQQKAIALMLEQPSMIKRPVLERGRHLLIGFKPQEYAETYSKQVVR